MANYYSGVPELMFEMNNPLMERIAQLKERDYEDKEFAQTLLRKTIENCQYYQSLISKSVKNWEFNRLAFMDVILMQMALAEMFSFSEIPVSVTINEYVEMAKYYSTPKSHKYINGILDAISKHLIKEHKLMKK